LLVHPDKCKNKAASEAFNRLLESRDRLLKKLKNPEKKRIKIIRSSIKENKADKILEVVKSC